MDPDKSVTFFDLNDFDRSKEELIAKSIRLKLENAALQRELEKRRRNPLLFFLKDSVNLVFGKAAL